jgi:predicted acyltransferase
VSPTIDMRHASIDTLRGLAILMMVFSGVIPYKVLPAWMYHAQLPPPTNIFDPSVAGITWVDLVFPMFLFTMGVAIPLALTRRLKEAKFSTLALHGQLLKRGLLLAAFAIFLQHVRPYTMNASPDAATWLIALAGFATMWMAFVKTDKPYWNALALIPAGLILFIGLPEYTTITFDVNRSDIILLVLANMAFYGAVAWFWTRNSLPLRLALMGGVAVLMLLTNSGTWSPAPWLTKIYFLKYLLIVLPGTIFGDWLLKDAGKSRVSGRTAGLGFLITLVTVIGLHQRWVIEAAIISLILMSIVWWLEKENRHPMMLWAMVWLVLGFALEPFQGGIHKDPSTFSYYFVTSGLTIWIWFGLKWLEEQSVLSRTRNLLSGSGRNPMVAYVAFMNLLLPVLALTGLAGLIASYTASPWVGAFRGFVYTLIVAWLTAITARRSWYWKS